MPVPTPTADILFEAVWNWSGAGVIRINRERIERFGSVLREVRRVRSAVRRDGRRRPVPEGTVPVVIATWNVHSCVGLDARFAPERTAAVINELRVDAIGLQEIGWHHRGEAGLDQFAYLAEATGMRVLAAPTKHNDHAHYGNALLTKLPVREFRPLDLSSRFREPRGGLEAVLEAAGRPLRVIIAHLGLDPWERAAQIETIVGVLEEKPDLPTVFMGDLNEWTWSNPRLRRLGSAFEDEVAPRSFNAHMPTLRLDRVYVAGGAKLPICEAVRTKLTRHASDHLPVRFTVAVP